eukprot:TRINITY_DN1516_c0_g1_i2.p1 TRINITY_DN1516_c0_g1~~TRINITY_DN1516_c0_g1_i2.p1  ORF type:complete len:212 (+),score=41.28 TRINITY_DN1516_c0_g1_i2:64-699(+)
MSLEKSHKLSNNLWDVMEQEDVECVDWIVRQVVSQREPSKQQTIQATKLKTQESTQDATNIDIHVDGSCLGNPGPGGWSVIMAFRRNGKIIESKELAGGEPDTTNNRMELMAAIRALEDPNVREQSKIAMYTDSSYVKNGITTWISSWKKNNWKGANKKAVKNQELWQRLDQAAAGLPIEWNWVKGHSGDPQNERADQVARTQAQRYLNKT